MSKKIPSALLLNDIHVSKDNIPEFQKNWDEALYICDQYGIEDMNWWRFVVITLFSNT